MKSWARLKPLANSKHPDRQRPNVRIRGTKYFVLEWSPKAIKVEDLEGKIKYFSRVDCWRL